MVQVGRLPFTHSLTSIAGLARPNAILAHNLHGGYFDLRALPEISASHPFYWYLHDFWSFTGHCAFPLDCERWVTGCGSCPYLEIPPAIRRDNTRKNWRVKEGIYQNSKIHLIVPCEWLAGQVRESVLGHHGYPITVIPYGIDLELFRPPASPRSMEYKDDPEQELTGIFVANGPRSNPYKHFALLEKAMPELDARLAKRAGRSGRIRILAVGEPEESCLYEGKSVTLKVIPFVNETQVAKLLQSSDFYLHPSHNEITPLAIYEAMACGLPVIASNVGGIAEMFADHSEGLLVHDPTPDAWVDAILQLTGNLQGLREMGSAARARMESLGGSSRMLDQIESLLSDRARR
jgi:glycosyltransferase involved in cell wall biosynthesis